MTRASPYREGHCKRSIDNYAAATDRIIAQLEAGQIPWHKPRIASGQAVSRSTGEKIQDPFLRDYSCTLPDAFFK